jgi:putative alpha-1,2-mannosidase
MILLDLTDLSESRQDNASVTVDPDAGRMTGNGRFLPSFGTGNYVLFFCVDFRGSTIRDSGIWVNSRGSDQVEHVKISRGINSGGPLPGGAFVRFTTDDTVTARAGLSFKSSDQACSIAESEIPTYDFDSVHSAAVDAWRTKLSPITIATRGVNTSLIKNFYSGIYRTMVNPQNYTGFVPVVSSYQIWFDSFY